MIPYEEKKSLVKTARFVRNFIRVVSGILIFPFAWLKFQNFDFSPVTSDITADFLLRLSLLIYYVCWVFGGPFDVNIQEEIYIYSPRKKNTLTGLFIFGLILTLIFGLLCWVNTIVKFLTILSIFLLFDLLGWAYMSFLLIKSPLQKTIEKFKAENDYYCLLRADFIKDYMKGKWRLYRYSVGFFLIIFIIILQQTNLSNILMQLLPGNGKEFIISLSIFLYVLVMEIWAWIMRFRIRAIINSIDIMENNYSISKL